MPATPPCHYFAYLLMLRVCRYVADAAAMMSCCMPLITILFHVTLFAAAFLPCCRWRRRLLDYSARSRHYGHAVGCHDFFTPRDADVLSLLF